CAVDRDLLSFDLQSLGGESGLPADPCRPPFRTQSPSRSQLRQIEPNQSRLLAQINLRSPARIRQDRHDNVRSATTIGFGGGRAANLALDALECRSLGRRRATLETAERPFNRDLAPIQPQRFHDKCRTAIDLYWKNPGGKVLALPETDLLKLV